MNLSHLILHICHINIGRNLAFPQIFVSNYLNSGYSGHFGECLVLVLSSANEEKASSNKHYTSFLACKQNGGKINCLRHAAL